MQKKGTHDDHKVYCLEFDMAFKGIEKFKTQFNMVHWEKVQYTVHLLKRIKNKR